MPELQQDDLRRVLKESPSRSHQGCDRHSPLVEQPQAGMAVRALQHESIDLEKAMQEATRLDMLGLVADVVGQAQQLEQAVLKLHTSWRRLGGLHERLWLESGSSTPYLRSLLQGLETLSGSNLRVSLGELAGGKRLRCSWWRRGPISWRRHPCSRPPEALRRGGSRYRPW